MLTTYISKTNSIIRTHSFAFLCISLCAVYSIFLFQFVANDNLASLVSDSVHYVIMAQYMSPWHEANDIIISSWINQEFPPFFPFLLAIFGLAYNYNAAHIFVAILIITSLPVIYFYYRNNNIDKWPAFFLILIFALSPSVFINTKGILSENLYILISFLIFFAYDKSKSSTYYLYILGGLFFLLFETRTIGITMLFAFIIVESVLLIRNRPNLKNVLIPPFCFLILFVITNLYSGSVIPAQYIQQLQNIFSGSDTYNHTVNYLLENSNSLYYSWMKSWLYYWFDYRPATIAIIVLGVFSTLGLLARTINYKLDSIYTFLYIFTLLIWPHPGQSFRFLYPILALLLFYSFFFYSSFIKRYFYSRTVLSNIIFTITFLTCALPAFSFTVNRHISGKSSHLNNIAEYYTYPDLLQAEQKAIEQLIILQDFKSISKFTKKDASIHYFVPDYINLLSSRSSKKIAFYRDNDNLITADKELDGDYIYLTKLHPRKSKDKFNGLDVLPYFSNQADIIWTHNSSIDNNEVSILLKIRK